MANGLCRLTGKPLTPVIDFGELYVNNFVEGDPSEGPKFQAKLGIGDSGLLQLWDTFPQEEIYGKHYWYRSGVNETMKRELKSIVDAAKRWVDVRPGDVVLDIAANDGTLLANWSKDLYRIGIDPASNLAWMGAAHADRYVVDFFSQKAFYQKAAAPKPAKVITSIAMFYDLENPLEFVQQLRTCLADDGLWILQLSYLPLMLSQNEFPNIGEEHLEYYTLEVLRALLAQGGFRIVDVELNDTNSGSFRIYATPTENTRLALAPHSQEIGQHRIAGLLANEKLLDLQTTEPYHAFQSRVYRGGEQLRSLLGELKAQGKRVLGLGASTKGNTLLQVWGITPELLPAIGERSPEKVGKKTVGTGIPIISEEELRGRRPDYLLALPYHFVRSFRQREAELIKGGTRFIVPLPTPTILE